MRVDSSSFYKNVNFFFAEVFSKNVNVSKSMFADLFNSMPLSAVVNLNDMNLTRIDLSVSSFNGNVEESIKRANAMLEAAYAAQAFKEVVDNLA